MRPSNLEVRNRFLLWFQSRHLICLESHPLISVVSFKEDPVVFVSTRCTFSIKSKNVVLFLPLFWLY